MAGAKLKLRQQLLCVGWVGAFYVSLKVYCEGPYAESSANADISNGVKPGRKAARQARVPDPVNQGR